MFLSWTFVLDLFLSILFVVLLIVLASIFIIRDLKKAFVKVFRIQSKFDIELRKLVNLMSKLPDNDKFDAFEKVVIKELPHEQKKILLKLIDEIFETVDLKNEENTYIAETYERLQETRRLRDTKVLVYNNKIIMFPYNIYVKFMKMPSYELYTTQ